MMSLVEDVKLQRLSRVLESNVQDLLSSVDRVYRIFEPWFQAKCTGVEVEEVQTIIKAIRSQGWKFAEAMTMSTKMSSDGCTLAQEALELYTSLASGQSETNIQVFLNGLLEIADRAHQDAQAVSDEFRAICKSIVEIHELTLPNVMRSLAAKIQKCENRQSTASTIKWVAGTTKTVLAQGGSVGMLFPPLGIVLPVLLPVADFFLQQVNKKCENSIAKRAKEQLGFEGALDRIQSLADQLQEAYTCIYKFVDWWALLKDKLSLMKRRFEGGFQSSYDQASLRTMCYDWTSVRLQYEAYSSALARIQDHYHFPSPSAAAAMALQDQLAGLRENVQGCLDGVIRLQTVVNIIRGTGQSEFQSSLESIRIALVTRFMSVTGSLRLTMGILSGHDEHLFLTAKVSDGGKKETSREHAEELMENVFPHFRTLERILVRQVSSRKSIQGYFSKGNETIKRSNPQRSRITSKAEGLRVLSAMESASRLISGFSFDGDLSVFEDKTKDESASNWASSRNDSHLARIFDAVRGAVHMLEHSKDVLESNRGVAHHV